MGFIEGGSFDGPEPWLSESDLSPNIHNLLMAPATPVVHPEEDRTSQIGISASHLREVTVITDHDAALVSFVLEGDEAIAGLIKTRLVLQTFRRPPQVRLAVVRHDSCC